MPIVTRVAGTALSGQNVTLMFGKVELPCLKATYGDSLETDVGSFMGHQAIDFRTAGTYKCEDGKVSVESSVFRAILMPSLVSGFGNQRMQLVIAFTHPDLGSDSDMLDRARLVGLAAALENSNKASEVEFSIVYDQVYWTDKRITINQADMTQPLAKSNI